MDRGGESLPRPGAGRSNDDAEAGGIVRVQVRRVDVSSTDIRARAARGEDVSDLVPSAVGRLIAGGRLYRI
jgi:nicotinic acid mononucleotide adenylyltransferase